MRRRVSSSEYKCKVVAGAVIILLIIYFRHHHWLVNEVVIPQYHLLDLKQYPDLGITAVEAFPVSGDHRIPKIIHQTWKDENIPSEYIHWVTTWIRNHPDWTYMFWTDKSAHQLIQDRYPELLPTFNSYSENIRRADALRYIILYEYGGVYADLDMESLRPLDEISRKYSCFLAQEPYEHPILDKNSENLTINALMGCRAKHPFMKHLVDNLPMFSDMWSVLDSTGPHYMTLHYRHYVQERKLDAAHEDSVYLAPAEYFFPSLDPVKFSYMKESCYDFAQKSYIQKRACLTLKHRGLERKPYTFSFTNHHWSHTYFRNKFTLSKPVNIFEISPKTKIYQSEKT